MTAQPSYTEYDDSASPLTRPKSTDKGVRVIVFLLPIPWQCQFHKSIWWYSIAKLCFCSNEAFGACEGGDGRQIMRIDFSEKFEITRMMLKLCIYTRIPRDTVQKLYPCPHARILSPKGDETQGSCFGSPENAQGLWVYPLHNFKP